MRNQKNQNQRKNPARSGQALPLASLLRICADQTRLRLLNLVTSEEEVCVNHLVEVLGASQPKVSRHLACLKRAGLVSDRRDGLWVYYRLAEPLDEDSGRLIEYLLSCFAGSSEMQFDAARLRALRTTQSPARFTGRAASIDAPAQPHVPVSLIEAEHPATASFSVSDLEIELL
jgi:ArsR family transcriptional regulator